MARTKAEVRAFLDSKIGTTVLHPGYPDLKGQCVTLTKALMEFLGIPNPYKARGNAKDAGDTMLREGIASNGVGWLTIVVNRDMGYIDGVHYGHIWIDLQNESNYESNGARALITTKNTRPISQGQQFINLDKWITEEDMAEKITPDTSKILQHAIIARNGLRGRAYALDGSTGLPWVDGELTNQFIADVFNSPEARQWRDTNDPASVNDINRRLDSIPTLQATATTAQSQAEQLGKVVVIKDAEIDRLTKENASLKAQIGDNSKWETLKALIRELIGK